uniref:Uncharacterized protein n=1 Tax=Meloidogyne hapla TaxID=6305 RepID=A0A1I8BFM7_MELHA
MSNEHDYPEYREKLREYIGYNNKTIPPKTLENIQSSPPTISDDTQNNIGLAASFNPEKNITILDFWSMGQVENVQFPSPCKYGIDLKGGFTSFAVYSKGLTSSVIMGNSVSSLLRIVAVENKSGGVIERVYDHPMFIPVLPRELNEVEIELRWMNGSLVKFDHGTVIVTLMFNKLIKF